MPNLFNLDRLRRNRSYVLIVAFVGSAVVHWRGPPDATSMTIMAVSMYLVFEAGLFVGTRIIKR